MFLIMKMKNGLMMMTYDHGVHDAVDDDLSDLFYVDDVYTADAADDDVVDDNDYSDVCVF